MKSDYVIELHGCDDCTSFTFALNEEEYELLLAIANKSENESQYVCMPILSIRKQDHGRRDEK